MRSDATLTAAQPATYGNSEYGDTHLADLPWTVVDDPANTFATFTLTDRSPRPRLHMQRDAGSTGTLFTDNEGTDRYWVLGAAIMAAPTYTIGWTTTIWPPEP